MATIVITFAVLLRILSNPVANVFQKQLTNRRHHPITVNFVTYLLLSIGCIFFALQINFTKFPLDFWVYAVLGGLMGATGNGLLVKALQMGDLSVLGPVNAYKSVVGILFGIILLHEVPGVAATLGVALIIYGSYFVLSTGGERFSFALLKRRDIQYRIGAMVLTAIEAVFIKKVILYSSPQVAFITWCWFGALFSLLMLPLFRVKFVTSVQKLFSKDFTIYFSLVLCIGIMQYTTNYVLSAMPVGYALSLFQLSIIISVLLGKKYFNEQDINKKLIGSVIMIAGSVLVILFK